MKKIVTVLFILSLAAAVYSQDAVSLSIDKYGGKYITDQFVVIIKPGVDLLSTNTTSAGKVYTGNGTLDLLCAQNSIVKVEPFYPHSVKNDILRSLVERIYIFTTATGKDAQNAYENFLTSKDVESSDLYSIPDMFFTPNDPSLSQQWALRVVNASQAWDVVRGDSTRTAIVGIVDTGVYWHHPDLHANIWLNSGEDINHDGVFDASDINGEDDDNNSYVDDGAGWDLGVGDNNPDEETPTHGTHVAGCAAEVTNNGVGGAGLGYSARLMCVKITNHAGTLTQGYQGMIYAADNGADIINMSWGSPSYTTYGQNVCTYTYAAGVLNVAAAGNDDYYTPPFQNYPSAYNHVFAVASSAPDDRLSSFSNYNTWVDICSPGQDIYSTWDQSSYANESGTSMASPICAGLAALIKAQNPSWTPDEIAIRIQETSVNIDSLNPDYIGRIGSGRIDAYAALAMGRYPNIQLLSHAETLTTDDGDGVINPGESIRVNVLLKNIWADGNNVIATLRGPASVNITDSISNFGSFIGNGAERDNASDPFMLTFPLDIIPGQYNFTMVLTSSDPYYNSITFPIRVTLEKAGFPLSLPDAIESNLLIFDINGDGTNEILAGANDSKLYAIEPNGTYLAGWPVEVSDDVNGGAAVGDIDHDGNFEVVTADRAGDIYAFHANGTLMPGFPIATGPTMFATPTLGDLNGDGHLEIIATNLTTKNINIFNSDGSVFGNWPYTGAQGWYSGAALGDIDNDNQLEIIIGSFDSKLYAFNTDKSLVPGFPVTLDGRVWGTAAIGNIDPSDLSPEICVASYTGSVYVIDHDGSIVSGWPVSVGTNIKASPTLADLDGDGNPEVIIGAMNSCLYVYHNNGTLFSGFPITLAGPIRNSAVVGDISGDHLPDIIAAAGSAQTYVYAFNTQGQSLRNFPILTASPGQVIGSPALWDLDRDGAMEIAVGVQANTTNLDVIDYKTQAMIADLKWPFFGNDIYHSNNYHPLFTDINEPPLTRPVVFGLEQNYPNPFNSKTIIRYSIDRPADVQLEVYDILGRSVRHLGQGSKASGSYDVVWDGKDNSGNESASGVYFYRLKAGDNVTIKRMMYLK